MTTVDELKKVVEVLDGKTPKDNSVVEFTEALNDFKKMIADGFAVPRGNQQEDITSRNRYMFP